MPTNKQQVFQALAQDQANANKFFALKFVFNAVSSTFDVFVEDVPSSGVPANASQITSAGTAITGSGSGQAPPFPDNAALVANFADSTRKAIFDASLITTGTTRTFTLPDRSSTLATLGGDQTFSGNNIFQRIGLGGTTINTTRFSNLDAIIANLASTTYTGQYAKITSSLAVASSSFTAQYAEVKISNVISSNGSGIAVQPTATLDAGASINALYGVNASVSVTGTINTSGAGNQFVGIFNAGGSAPIFYGSYSELATIGTGIVTEAYAFYGRLRTIAAGTITNAYGLALRGWANGGTITTSYGIYADTSIDVGTTRWFIHSLSTSPSLLTGNLTVSGTFFTTSPRITTGLHDLNGNEMIGFTAVASAVNEITVSNNSVGVNPVISATGDDTNIGITLTPKGTGAVVLTGSARAPDGTGALPAYAFSGNTAMGMSRNGNEVRFSDGSFQRLTYGGAYVSMANTMLLGWANLTVNPSSTMDVALFRNAAGRVEINNGAAGSFRDLILRQYYADQTITAGGTTGNQTINKSAGTVNVAAGGTTVTVTCNLCTASSLVFVVVRTNDATATIKNCVPGAGSFVITLTAAATAEVSIGFLVVNQ